MTTTPGYTVEALLQAIDEIFTDGGTREQLIARAAELTQVTAQSVERASPAKDGGEQGIASVECQHCGNKFNHDLKKGNTVKCPKCKTVLYLLKKPESQPLAPQMRPQSAVQGWQPIATVPVNKTVALLCAYRHMSDDLLGCGKDIGYLTDGGWFSTCGELRAMSRDAFTHWKAIPPDSLFAAPQPPQGEDK